MNSSLHETLVYSGYMKILVIGGGGREHALIWKLSQSQKIFKIYCAPGNAGIELLAQCIPIESSDLSLLLDFAVSQKIDLTIVMPAKVVIIEFKLKKYGDAKEAIAQIKTRQYPQKYISRNLPIYLIGMSFDSDMRNVVDLVTESYIDLV